MAGRVEILAIGDELLSGETADTNSSWLDGELEGLGFSVARHVTVPDDEGAIAAAFREGAARADLLLSTGGLGPTDDDLTFAGLAAALGCPLRRDEGTLAHIAALFAAFGRTMTPNNARQADVPAIGEVMTNEVGTAPGFTTTLGGCRVFSMPGVPREVRWLFQHRVKPRLGPGPKRIARRTLRVVGLGESKLEHEIKDLVAAAPAVRVGYRALGVENHVKLYAEGEGAAAAIAGFEAAVRARLGDRVFGADAEDLGALVAARLTRARATVAVAESCTGGLVGKLLSDRAGSSAYFEGGVIAYANAVKTGVLGVSPETLAADGAVSEGVARQMADGVRRLLGATVGLSATGIAGPDGGSADKPVGTVFIGVSTAAGTTVERLRLLPDRELVRSGTATHLLWRLAKLYPDAE